MTKIAPVTIRETWGFIRALAVRETAYSPDREYVIVPTGSEQWRVAKRAETYRSPMF